MEKQTTVDLGDIGEAVDLGVELDPFTGDGGLSLESERSTTLLGMFSRRGGETDAGVWFPLLGPGGQEVPALEEGGRPPRMRVAREGNDDYSELLSKLVEKHGGRKGKVPFSRMQWFTPLWYAKTLLLEIDGDWVLGVDAEGRFVDTVRDVQFQAERGKGLVRERSDVRFDLGPDGRVRDSMENRRKLLVCFPHVQEQVWTRAKDLAAEDVGDGEGVESD